LEEYKMLLAVAENFKKYTLEALPTLLEKIAYISSLQNENGSYTHWGLSRIFGEQKAQKAIQSAHSQLVLDALRSPIRSLCRQYEIALEETKHPDLLNPESLELKAPATGDELLSAHLRLVEESLAVVADRKAAPPKAA
jgi:hypothetical protein